MTNDMTDVAGLLGLWASGTGPLYDQLALGIIRLIESGDIVVGTRLPPERDFAKALAVSRTTIISAYAKLQELGWLERRQGAGTWVTRPVEDSRKALNSPVGATSYAITRVLNAAVQPAPGVIDLATAAYKDAHHVHDVLASLLPEDLAVYGELGGYHPLGIPELRSAVATFLSQRGVPTTLNQVVITTGVQQAAQIILSVYAPTGHPVAVESPTWNCILDILRMLGGVVIPLPVDDRGAVLGEISRLAQTSNLRAIWMTSGYHNPTGVEVARERVHEAARLAEETRTPIIENATLRELGLRPGNAPLTVAHYAPTGPVITVGSLSKLLSPVLRLAWLRAPESIVRQIARQKTVWDSGSSLLPQIVAARLLESWADIAASRRETTARNLAAAESALQELLPDWSYRAPDGGQSLWVTMPRGDSRPFAHLAMREGVEVLPGSIFSWEDSPCPNLRVSLTRSPAETVEGLGRLARAWRKA
ncbi:PLP-dependent aminotransferase family protein [Streptosporangium sp. NPDC051022]|uniref:aminotransferase-like domain-containing protein n=1 Tax=Streptosporangium sp. NPDC051022 TaxID=3155752 RepID=UPI0034172109